MPILLRSVLSNGATSYLPQSSSSAGIALLRVRVKPAFLLLLTWLLLGCVIPGSRADPRDFAVTTCVAQPNEIELAQKRARNYLARHPGAGADVGLLAVEADYVFPSEIPDLWVKLGRSQTSSSAYLQRRGQSFKLFCVLLVDRSTLLPRTNQGYVLANTPARGAIAKIGGQRALYIGTGSF
jgi:hypothetical protein